MSTAFRRTRHIKRYTPDAAAVTGVASEISVLKVPKRGFINKIRVLLNTGTITTVRLLEKSGVAAGNLQEIASYSPGTIGLSETEDLWYELDDTLITGDWTGTVLVEVTASGSATASVQLQVENAEDAQRGSNVEKT